MSFFFGKKKGQHPHSESPAPRSGPASRDVSGGPSLHAAPVNGVKNKAAPGGVSSTIQTPAAGNSVNNSISSINGAKTPSPDHGRPDGPGAVAAGDRERERGGGSLDDGQVCTSLPLNIRGKIVMDGFKPDLRSEN